MEYQALRSNLFVSLVITFAVVGLNPLPKPSQVMVHDASADQIERLERAMTAFMNAGLELPPLEVWFPAETSSCRDAHGLFTPSEGVMEIRICSTDEEWVYLHELAHAWERANVTDEQRLAFLDLRGLEHWRDRDAGWKERGVEWAAVVIQQGLAGLPLPPVLSDETVSRLEGFELLTGRVAPTLATWVDSREVPCDQRPTKLSSALTDAEGVSCL